MTSSISNLFYVNSPTLIPIAVTGATALTINKLASYVESKLKLRPYFSDAPIKRKIAAFCITGLLTAAVSAAGTGLGLSSLPGALTITALASSICALIILFPRIQFKTYQLLAALRITSATYRLATFYEEGVGVAKDPAKAQKIYKKAADWGHKEAQYRVGVYSNNDHYLLLSEKQGNILASYELGLKYSKVKDKREEAFNCFKKAADAGHRESQFEVGRSLLKKSDPTQAVVYLSRAGNQGHAQSLLVLGYCYQGNQGVRENATLSFSYYQRAAEKQHSEASYMLGLCYLDGYGTDRNVDKSIEILQLLGEQKHSRALYDLGICNLEGNLVKQDIKKAFTYLLQAAELGHPEALCELGILYRDGIHFKEDKNKAFDYFKQAADENHPRGVYLLGRCYEKGLGIKPDLAQAETNYRAALHEEYPEAEYRVAKKYAISEKAAFDYFKRAAKSGLAKAKYRVALCYFDGKGTDKKRPKAIQYLKEAADQGHELAQSRLGDEYYSGKNITKNLELALYYYSLAAKKGNSHSQQRENELNSAS